MKPRALLTTVLTAALFATPSMVLAQEPGTPAERGLVTIGASSQYSTATNKPQRFIDYVEVSQGEAALPLTLTIMNGSTVQPGFNWVRVSLGGKTLFTQNNVFSKKEIPFNVSGLIGSGTSQIVVEAGGIPGSTLSWKLLAAQVAPTLQTIAPSKTGTGEVINLKGTNFAPKPSLNKVLFGGNINAEVKTAAENSLDVIVPSNAKPGDNKVTVTVGGATSNAVTVKVIAVPELESLSLESAPPGQELTLTGRNFSQKASENTVTIAGAQAEVVSASATSVTVIIPEVYNPQYAIPVTIEVNGVKAKNSLTMDIYNRVY